MICPDCKHDETYHGENGCFYLNKCECVYSSHEMKLVAELAALIAEREALRNTITIIGNYTGEEIKCDRVTERRWFDAAAALLKGGAG